MKFWLSTAFLEDPRDAFALVEAADRSGWHGVTLSDHLFDPEVRRTPYPYTPDGTPRWEPLTPWPDPWVTIGALAARTADLHFTTNVYVAPARDLWTVAKQVSTAAVLSGDRVALGVGAGWCEEEFEQTGQDFATRGKRLNEMIPALRQLWAGGFTEFHGDHVDFPSAAIAPVPGRPIPIHVGGDSKWALRRAATLGDGWIGQLYPPDEAEQKVAAVKAALAEAGRADDPGFEIILALFAPDDPDLFRRFEELGVTGVTHAPWMLVEHTDDRDELLRRRVEAVERLGQTLIAEVNA